MNTNTEVSFAHGTNRKLVRFSEPVTIGEAIQASGLAVPVERVPVCDAQGKPIPGFYATRRGSEYIAQVGNRYEPTTEAIAWERLRPLQERFGPCIVAAGELARGVSIVQLQLPNCESDITDYQRMRSLLTLVLNHKGLANFLSGLAENLFCANQMGRLAGSSLGKVVHTSSWKGQLESAVERLSLAHGSAVGKYRQLAAAPADELDVIDLVETVTERGHTQWTPRIEQYHEDISVRFQAGIGTEGRTQWDLLNAVTEYETHERRSKNRLQSVMVGRGAKIIDVASQLCLEKAGVA